MRPDTVCGGAVVESAEGAAAPHEGGCGEGGGVQGREAPTAAEAHARWSQPRRLSGDPLAGLTVPAGVAAVSIEAAAPSVSMASVAAAGRLSSTSC